VVDKTWDDAACKAYGVELGQVTVMIHTGSRGLGHQVCEDHVKDLQAVSARHGIALADRQLACAPLDTPEAARYMAAMAAAANFAFGNRSVITTHVRDTLGRVFGGGREGLGIEVVYDVCHNIAKMEEHVVPAGPDAGRRRRLCVHRKGATRAFGPGHPDVPADYRAAGQPVMVPGDMGRMSFLLAAQEGAMATSFGSSCHGAGRHMSRSEAKRSWSGTALLRELWERDGIYVRAATSPPRRRRTRTRTSARSSTPSRWLASRARPRACARSASSRAEPAAAFFRQIRSVVGCSRARILMLRGPEFATSGPGEATPNQATRLVLDCPLGT
jgi:tRNA-splicing ligase RtcB